MSDDASRDVADPVIAAADHLPLPEVPPDVSRRLRDAFRTDRTVIAAELVSDTSDGLALAGARSAGVSAWSMSYRAGTCDIVLDLTPEGAAVELNGQLLCPEPTPNGVLRVFDGDSLVTSTSTDEFGQFELGTLQPVSYTITIERADCAIEMIVDLSLRPPS